jgi:hypothetical protein
MRGPARCRHERSRHLHQGARPRPGRRDAGRHRRRLRRHRHQPALHDQGGVRAAHRRAARRRPSHRRGVGDLLGPDGRRDAQVRGAGAARRQSRRGRRDGAGGAGLAGGAPAHAHARGGADARRRGRGAVLRRQRAHAGHLGAGRDGGPGGHRARAEALRRARIGSDPAAAVRAAAIRHRTCRCALRADHRAVVRDAGRHRRAPDRADTAHPGGAESAARLAVPERARRRHPAGGGRDRAGHHRRRGAVRRHGPFRPGADPPGVARPGLSRAGDQLHGPGRAADARPGGAGEPVLPTLPRQRAAGRAAARHAGRDHRVAGGHLRRLLGHAAGASRRGSRTT